MRKIAIVVFIILLNISCSNIKKEYHANGKIKEISYFHFGEDFPYQIEGYNEEGVFKSLKNFNLKGVLINDVKMLDNGDSLATDYYTDSTSYCRQFMKDGNSFFYPLENKMIKGIGRFYKDSVLIREALYSKGVVYAFNEIHDIHDGQVIVMEDIGYSDSMVFTNDIFNKHVNLYMIDNEDKANEVGYYFKGVKANSNDTLLGCYSRMELKDTAVVGEIVEGIVRGGGGVIKEQDLYLSFENNVLSKEIEFLDQKIITSPKGELMIKFKVKFKRFGINFMSGYVEIKTADSEIMITFLVFDDIFIVPQ